MTATILVVDDEPGLELPVLNEYLDQMTRIAFDEK
jgi:hypothetical protein